MRLDTFDHLGILEDPASGYLVEVLDHIGVVDDVFDVPAALGLMEDVADKPFLADVSRQVVEPAPCAVALRFVLSSHRGRSLVGL